jgi:hypothetical protein
MSKLALLVGINYIGTQNELKGCINDILNMKNLLETKFGYTNSILLSDNTNMKPTRNNIINNLKNIVLNSNKYSEIFFHYSGHGTQTIDRNKDEIDSKDEAIVPLDFMSSGFIIDDELYTIIKDVKCNMKIVLDSCHSGTCIDLPYVSLFNSAGKLTTRRTDKNTSISQNYNIIMISGCRDEQYSSDIYDPATKKNCGALTNSLVNLITNNNNITLSLLLSSLNVILKYYSQNPALSSNKQLNLNSQFIQMPAKQNINPPKTNVKITKKTFNIKKRIIY